MSLQLQLALVTLSLLLSPINSWAAVGKVTEQTGPMEIVRNKKSISSSLNTAVEMNDAVSTVKAKAQLTFEDKTTVKLTEHSKIIIDDFVYDPKKGAGKLGMKMALGTARYASGQIAKNNPQQVAIKTPTASIAVRGTDFSMTVDELGRSLVMLLPSCDNKGCVTGVIEVSNLGGVVILDVPYQTTLVNSSYQRPSEPIVVNIDQANINNMLIISRPPELQENKISSTQSELDVNYLDVDFLKFTDLDRNELDDVKELDRNVLDVDVLGDSLISFSINELDAGNRSLLANQLDRTVLPNYNEASGLKYFFNDDKSMITLYRITTHTAFVTVDTSKNLQVIFNQDSSIVNQQVNKGGSTTINIIQQ
jgi:hypothetical protein